MLEYTSDHVEELAAPGGGWRVPKVPRWTPPVVEDDVSQDRSVYCSGSPIHRLCIGYDPQTKQPCSCSCHDKGTP